MLISIDKAPEATALLKRRASIKWSLVFLQEFWTVREATKKIKGSDCQVEFQLDNLLKAMEVLNSQEVLANMRIGIDASWFRGDPTIPGEASKRGLLRIPEWANEDFIRFLQGVFTKELEMAEQAIGKLESTGRQAAPDEH